MESQPESYAFVMDVSELEKEEFVIAPGHVLRRATPEEIETIRRLMGQATVGGLGPGSAQLHWEFVPPAGGVGAHIALPQEKWRYFVISFQGTDGEIPWIQQAADISVRELELGLTIMNAGQGWSHTPSRLFHFVHRHPYGGFCRPFSASDAVELSSIYSKLKAHDGARFNIAQTTSEIAQLKGMDSWSPLLVLGYFAVLEAILTHSPKLSDPYDSITRQIKNKIALLDNRWSPQINYSIFGASDPDKIWEKMYAYRSALAHGLKPDFNRELQVLKSRGHAFWLLKETVKSVARFALDDPQLLQDLKKC
jgi:hypothetical protein